MNARLAAAAVLILALAGCSSSSSAGGGAARAVPASALAAEIGTQLQKQKVAVDAGSLTCPQGLTAAVGQGAICRFTSDGQPVGAAATVTKVDGDTVGFAITTLAQPVPKAVLATGVKKQLGTGTGLTIDSVSCHDDLPAQVGGRGVTCDVTSGGDSAAFRVRATAITGGRVTFAVDTR